MKKCFILEGFLAVGSNKNRHVKAEFYEFVTCSWMNVSDYHQDGNGYIYGYDMLYIEPLVAFYVIGGFFDNSRGYRGRNIAKFQNGTWSDVGKLNNKRQVSF